MKTEIKKNLKAALAELRAERKDLDKRIVGLESILADDKPARVKTSRGRAGTHAVPSSRWTPEMRKAAKERMRKYWAKRKAARNDAG
jgi:hypothetical protein